MASSDWKGAIAPWEVPVVFDAVNGKNRGAKAGSRFVVKVSVGSHEELCRSEVTYSRRKQQWRVAPFLDPDLMIGMNPPAKTGLPQLLPDIRADLDIGPVLE